MNYYVPKEAISKEIELYRRISSLWTDIICACGNRERRYSTTVGGPFPWECQKCYDKRRIDNPPPGLLAKNTL